MRDGLVSRWVLNRPYGLDRRRCVKDSLGSYISLRLGLLLNESILGGGVVRRFSDGGLHLASEDRVDLATRPTMLGSMSSRSIQVSGWL